MQGRYRHPSDGRAYSDGRGYNSNYRRFSRSDSGNYSRKQYLPPPPRSKEEILLEAGRLAAEYLVYKGLLPANSLPSRGQNGRYQGYRGSERDAPVADGRTSALNRLGNLNPDVGNGRKRYNDDYDRTGSRSHFRGKKRMGSYSRDYGSDWGRESGRWGGRNREYHDMEDEDDYAPGYQRVRRNGFEPLQTRSENTVESGSENHDVAEDTGSKVSSSSTRRDLVSEMDGALSKTVPDESKAINAEAGEEVKSNASGDLKMKYVGEESDAQAPCQTGGDGKGGDDLMKLCSFAKVPTKPRSSTSQRSPKADQGLAIEARNAVEGSSAEPEVTSGEVAMGDFSNSLTDQTDIKCQAPEDLGISSAQDVVDSSAQEVVDGEGKTPSVQEVEKRPSIGSLVQQHEERKSPPCIEYSVQEVDEGEETSETEGVKRQRDLESDELSRMHNVRAKYSSLEVEKPLEDGEKVVPMAVVEELPMEEEMVNSVAIKEERPLDDDDDDVFIPKAEEDKRSLPASFKICDLNLMHGPEITEIPDDPDHEDDPTLETGKEVSVNFDLSIGNDNNGSFHSIKNNGTNDFSKVSEDDKVVQVINLEDDTTVDDTACDSSKPKDEPIYPNLDTFLDQPEHADLQDSYSLVSEFLGTDISRCPSVPSDLNNLQAEMGLHDAEGVPNDDDSIYVSLGEIPIGFMEVWDQPPQEYGKFF